MRPETALRAILMDDATVTGYVGARLTRRVAQQTSEHPFGIFTRTKTDPHYNMDGDSTLREVEVMFAWYHTDLDALDLLVRAAEAALSGFSGDVDGLPIDTVYLTDERDGDVLIADGSGEPLWCIEQIFRTAYNLE